MDDITISNPQEFISILDCVPYSDKPLRQEQIDALLFIEANYHKFRYLCLCIPTGVGKSWIATTYNNWIIQNNLGKTADITPTKLLQDQYSREFTWIPDLKGQNSYCCGLLVDGGSCADYKRYNPLGKLCGGPAQCSYMAAKSDAQQAGAAIFNFHSYFYNEMYEYKDHIVIDEGHNTSKFLENLYTINLWGCELGFDKNQESSIEAVTLVLNDAYKKVSEELADAIKQKMDIVEELEALQRQIESVISGINIFGKDILIIKKEELYKKKRWLKRNMSGFYNTHQIVIKIKPLSVKNMGTNLWPISQKVLFLSATINHTDMEELGIKKDEYAYFESGSPIPPDQRRFVAWPCGSMNRNNQDESLPKMIDSIKKLAEKWKDSKGLIHCTYALSEILKKQNLGPRFMFHGKGDNKNEVYHQFRESKEPKILVACGMSEGIDLPDDYARWQIILKVPYPSLEDDVWRWKASNNRRAYVWETIKTIIQQTGRICRGPKDRGFTYILDSEFEKLYQIGLRYGMWPKYFQESVTFVSVK